VSKILAILVAFFLIAPLAIIVPMSFGTSGSLEFPPHNLGFVYYKNYFTNPDWILPTRNSLVIATLTVLVTMLITIPAAYGYIHYRFLGRGAVNVLIMLPLMVPQVVSALAYYGFLSSLRINGTILGVAIAHTSLASPVAFLVLCAAFKGFDRNLERAAMGLGAAPLRVFLEVIFPVLRPSILVAGLFAFLQSFNESVVIIFIGGREASTLPKRMFESIRIDSDPTIAVISTVLTSAVLTGILVSLLFRRRRAS
jgi:putative spermidine/putrescine transport system permease protein